jgi:transposase
MSGFIEGEDRNQATMFPERLDDCVAEDHPVRVIDVFIDDLDVSGLGFKAEPAATGRPGYRPKMMLKLYVYGYLNRVQSSRRLGGRSTAQYRADVADRQPGTGLQDHRRLQERQR